VDAEVVDVQPIVVQGFTSGPIVQDLGNIMLMEQVSMKLMCSCKKCYMF